MQKWGALRGWTGRELIEGFHGVAPVLLKAGSTASEITHTGDQDKTIATGS